MIFSVPDLYISFLTSTSIQFPPLVVLTMALFRVNPSMIGMMRVANAEKSMIRLVGRPDCVHQNKLLEKIINMKGLTLTDE